MILRFEHGWGYDASFWEPLAALLPEWDHAIADRGYFGSAIIPDPSPSCVVIAHSFGAMHVLATPPPRLLGMVAINAFDRFTGPEGVPARVVDRMIARIDSNPAAVLHDFRARLGDTGPAGNGNTAALRADLETLRNADCAQSSAALCVPLLSLQSADDPLLPPALRDAAFAAAPLRTLDIAPSGGHLLPRTDPEGCARAVRALVEQVA